MTTEDIVAKFIADKNVYSLVRAAAGVVCESLLFKSGIPHVTSNRVKDEGRLREKLMRKEVNENKSYKDISEITDLVGVRISTYFPSQIEEVVENIKQDTQNIEVLEEARHPTEEESKRSYLKPLPGYSAVHLVVRIIDPNLCDEAMAAIPVEIQITSVLMHAWSEVEHDLMYKKITGEPSEDERQLLKSSLASVMGAEMAIDQIRKKIQERNGDDLISPFELNEFIKACVARKIGKDVILHFNNTDAFYLFLGENNLLSRKSLREIVDGLTLSITSTPFSWSIHALIAQNVESSGKAANISYNEARRKASSTSAEDVPKGCIICGEDGVYLYWYNNDGKRYVIVNQATYLSWFPQGSRKHFIRRVSNQVLANIPIGGNVTYKPGVKILKVQNGASGLCVARPKDRMPNIPANSFNKSEQDGEWFHIITGGDRLYVIAKGGIARECAPDVLEQIYGKNWRDLVEELPDAFFTNYGIGDAVFSIKDYDPESEKNGATLPRGDVAAVTL